VIGRPWENPEARPDYIVTSSEGDDYPEPDDPDPNGGDVADDIVRVGPDGIDDPETEWAVDAPTDALPPLSPDEIWLLIPGEPLLVVTTLPKPKHVPLGLAIRPGEIAVCSGRQRRWSRTPLGGSDEDAALPVAHLVLVVFIRHRAKGVRTKPRKYVIVTNDDGEMLGWLDYSDAWNFEGQILKQMVEGAGLAYAVERYGTEPEFERAHPEWVN
jgi:hypothetical protein